MTQQSVSKNQFLALAILAALKGADGHGQFSLPWDGSKIPGRRVQGSQRNTALTCYGEDNQHQSNCTAGQEVAGTPMNCPSEMQNVWQAFSEVKAGGAASCPGQQELLTKATPLNFSVVVGREVQIKPGYTCPQGNTCPDRTGRVEEVNGSDAVVDFRQGIVETVPIEWLETVFASMCGGAFPNFNYKQHSPWLRQPHTAEYNQGEQIQLAWQCNQQTCHNGGYAYHVLFHHENPYRETWREFAQRPLPWVDADNAAKWTSAPDVNNATWRWINGETDDSGVEFGACEGTYLPTQDYTNKATIDPQGGCINEDANRPNHRSLNPQIVDSVQLPTDAGACGPATLAWRWDNGGAAQIYISCIDIHIRCSDGSRDPVVYPIPDGDEVPPSDCTDGCARCDDNDVNVCLEAQPRWYLDESNTAQPCGNHCDHCIDSGRCQTCAERHFNVSGSAHCEECGEHCASCDDRTSCNECASGYGTSSSSDACVPCETGCKSCANDACIEADDGYYLDDNSPMQCGTQCAHCVNANSCETCQQGWNRGEGRDCFQCGDNCSTCSPDECETCDEGYWLHEGDCRKCDVGFEHCATCDHDTGVCQSCTLPLQLNDEGNACVQPPAGETPVTTDCQHVEGSNGCCAFCNETECLEANDNCTLALGAKVAWVVDDYSAHWPNNCLDTAAGCCQAHEYSPAGQKSCESFSMTQFLHAGSNGVRDEVQPEI